MLANFGGWYHVEAGVWIVVLELRASFAVVVVADKGAGTLERTFLLLWVRCIESGED